MTEDEMRDALDAVLEQVLDWNEGVADHLLPVVRKIAADELRAAADGIGDWPGVGNAIKGQLRDRSRDLDPS